jgi:hypothetical protein
VSEIEQRTELGIGLDMTVLGTTLRLAATVGGEGGGASSFRGFAAIDRDLRGIVNEFYRFLSGNDGELFDADSFPDITCKTIELAYTSAPSRFSIEAVFKVEVLGQLRFAFARLDPSKDQPQEPRYLVGLRSDAQVKLSDLAAGTSGVIGQMLGDAAIDGVGLFYASDEIKAEEIGAFAGGEKRGFAKGPSFSVRFGLRDSFTALALPPSLPPVVPTDPKPVHDGYRRDTSLPAGKTPDLKSAPGTPAGPMRFWKDVNQTFGPLQLRRIGGEWDNGKLGILLDAAVELLGLKVGLAGLGVKLAPSKLTTLRFQDLTFSLDGLEIGFERGPISISGALLRSGTGDDVVYSGMAMIRASTFSIGAIGSYGQVQGQASFFIFGAFTGILGGPPCFVVEGIAAGFGYNRAIVLPEIEEVRSFPLVSLVLAPSPGSSTKMLEELGKKDRFPPTVGQYWIAAGIKFSSFKLVEAFALATVQFGTRLEIGLLGVATMQQPPKPAPPFVSVELALKVRFAPDEGVLSVQAVLTENSYLFDRSCRLTGGFAFVVWFKPTDPKALDRSGDFVLTFGGYHPKFLVPAHYPRVPRVGFNWDLGDVGVTVRGEAYFALTPSFIMAGGRLSAAFRSGGFRAWFDAYADFLIGWAPFHYEAVIGIRIGASLTTTLGDLTSTLSFELGAELTLWGPPFAGEAYINLGIIAFTVPIGDRNASKKPTPIGWLDFASQFLPTEVAERTADEVQGNAAVKKTVRPLSLAILCGVISEHKVDGKVAYSIVNPSELRLSVETAVPATTFKRADELQPSTPDLWQREHETALGIRPMGQATLDSTLDFGWTGPAEKKAFAYERTLKNAPEALWSPQALPEQGAALKSDLIKNCLMGVQLMPSSPATVVLKTKKIEPTPLNPVQVRPPDATQGDRAPYYGRPYTANTSPAELFEPVTAALSRPGLAQRRKEALAAMLDAGFGPFAALTDPVDLAETWPEALAAAPWLVPIGQLLPPAPGA